THDPVCPRGVAIVAHDPDRPIFRITRPSLITIIKASASAAKTSTPFICTDPRRGSALCVSAPARGRLITRRADVEDRALAARRVVNAVVAKGGNTHDVPSQDSSLDRRARAR